MERARGASSSRPERQHIQILGLSIEAQPARALAALLEHAESYPRDALPLSRALGAFGLYAFSGRAEHDELRLELCRRLAPHYGEDWWMLTHLGWSHTEAGRLAEGARITERALELKRDNAHAAHAYAHFFAEARLADEGLRFVEAWLGGYGAAGTLYAHLHWHCALWHLERRDGDAAAAILRGVLHPAVSLAPPINVVSDCASLLWRFWLSHREPAGAQEVSQYASRIYRATPPPFIAWHLAMADALAGGGCQEGAPGESPAGPVLPAVCAAFAAFAAKRYAAVVTLLEPVRQDFVRLGGSGAQRRVLEETLEAARERAARAG